MAAGYVIRLLISFGIIFALQYASGAFLDGYSSYRDEPSHYVTSLMMRDFLAAGLPVHDTIRFAEDFYLHYPKVGLGHWPPAGYCFYGVWMLLFGPSRMSALLAEAFVTACCALLLYAVARRVGLNAVIAHGITISFVLLPIVQAHNDMVMLEVPLTFWSFTAALALVRLFERDRWFDGVLFGLLTSLAIMTKGNGWALPAMVPIAILLMRRYREFFNRRLWHAAVLTAAVCVPFTLRSMKMVKDGWAADGPSLHLAALALPRLGSYLFTMIGPVFSAFLIAGVIAKIILPLRRKATPDIFWAVMASYVVAAWMFHAIVPTGVEPRKLFTVIPALLLFAAAGMEFMIKTWPTLLRTSCAAPLTAAITLAFVATTVRVERGYCVAMTRAVEFLLPQPELSGAAFLVSSISDGEGRFIAELAEHEVWPRDYAVRATKWVADTNWLSTSYRLRYTTPEQVTPALLNVPIGIVIVHTEEGCRPVPHYSLVASAMADTSKWEKIYSDHAQCPRHRRGEQVDVYQYRLAPIRRPIHLEVDLQNKIGQTLRLENLATEP
jgi:hypothetical protein